MKPTRDLLAALVAGDLSKEDADEMFEMVFAGQTTRAQTAAIIMGLACKGPTVTEITSAARVMREHAIAVQLPELNERPIVLDTCGTGGDVKGTFNISTCAALMVAACNDSLREDGKPRVLVVKHGNRSITSSSGSADVLEALGVNVDAAGEVLTQCLAEANACFAFARHHHPAMKHVAAVRGELGFATVFNLLGPLTNPGGAPRQLIGVYKKELCELLAHVLAELGSDRAWVVHADDGLDELSTISPATVAEVIDGKVTTWRLDPAEHGFEPASISALKVHDIPGAKAAVERVLGGEKGPMRDIAVLNAAAGLVIAEVEQDLSAARRRVEAALDAGLAEKTLSTLAKVSHQR